MFVINFFEKICAFDMGGKNSKDKGSQKKKPTLDGRVQQLCLKITQLSGDSGECKVQHFPLIILTKNGFLTLIEPSVATFNEIFDGRPVLASKLYDLCKVQGKYSQKRAAATCKNLKVQIF